MGRNELLPIKLNPYILEIILTIIFLKIPYIISTLNFYENDMFCFKYDQQIKIKILQNMIFMKF